jgi:nucleoside-specific outer membrane channel protein Tsx
VLISSTEEMGSILNEKKNLILETTENKYEVQQIQQNKKINIDNIDSLKLKTLELEQKTNIIENKINTYQFKINFFKNIFNSGMAIMILGFILWYYKLQKFLDKML